MYLCQWMEHKVFNTDRRRFSVLTQWILIWCFCRYSEYNLGLLSHDLHVQCCTQWNAFILLATSKLYITIMLLFLDECACFQNHQPPGKDPRGDKGWRIDGILSLETSCTCFYFYLQTSREPSVQTFKEYLALVSWREKSSLTNNYYECAVE